MTKNKEKIRELLKEIEVLLKEENEVDILREYVGDIGLEEYFKQKVKIDGTIIKNTYKATDAGNSKIEYMVETDNYIGYWVLYIFVENVETGRFKISKDNMSFKYFCKYVIRPITEGIVFDLIEELKQEEIEAEKEEGK